MMGGPEPFSPHMEAVARRLCGTPNKAQSSPSELRFGSHGSLSVDLKKGTWFDHEADTGGGVLDLIMRETGQDKAGAIRWFKSEMGVELEDRSGRPPRNIIATYDYCDTDGVVAYQVVRFDDPRDRFRQRRPDGNGGWTWSLKGVDRLPYRLPELLASGDATVLIPGGEKDVENLRALGFTATTNSEGEGKWRPEFAEHLKGRRVVVLCDNDAKGEEHARAVCAGLHGSAADIRVVRFPELPEKGDVSDWIGARRATGRSDEQVAEDLVQRCAAAPIWQPEPADEPRANRFITFDEITIDTANEWLIEDVAPLTGIAVTYGQSTAGKSFFKLDQGMHVALGWPWYGREVERGLVVYIAAEGGRGVKKRLAAFRQRFDVGQRDVPFVLLPETVNLLDPEADAGALIDDIHRLADRFGLPPRMVVVDTLSRAMVGGSENAPEDMGAFIANCDRIAKQTDALCDVVHHPGKDVSRGSRGHYKITADVDQEIAVTKHGEVSTAEITKLKDGEVGETFSFRLEQVHLGTNERGKPITSCVIVPAEGGHARRNRLSPALQVAYDQLVRAVDNAGTGGTALLEQWRDACHRAALGGDNAESRKKAFQRSRIKLQELGFIVIDDPYVRLTRAGVEAGQDGT